MHVKPLLHSFTRSFRSSWHQRTVVVGVPHEGMLAQRNCLFEPLNLRPKHVQLGLHSLDLQEQGAVLIKRRGKAPSAVKEILNQPYTIACERSEERRVG